MLNGSKEDVEMLRKRMEDRRLRAKPGKVTGGPASVPHLPESGAQEEPSVSAWPPPLLQSRHTLVAASGLARTRVVSTR